MKFTEHLLFLVAFFRFKLKVKIRVKRERPTSDDFPEMQLMRVNASILSDISSRLVEELVLLRKTYLSRPLSLKLKVFSFFNGLTSLDNNWSSAIFFSFLF